MAINKILSVDDSNMIHMVVGRALKPFSVEVFYAGNGVEGLAIATRETPNLILLDVTMPVMDGVECLNKLKADPLLKEIPVIMLTAEAGKENVIKIAKMGIRDYIVKPFKEETLIDRISRVLDLRPRDEVEEIVRTIDDPANILIVEDKPAIVEQIKSAIPYTAWNVHNSTTAGDAIDYIAKQSPDLVLVSLSLPDKSAFSLFQMVRTNAKTKGVPVFGLSVKTSTDEQAQAQGMGFNGIITKPLDTQDLMLRMVRSMNLDTSTRYFAIENGIQVIKLPKQVSSAVISELITYVPKKTQEMVESGMNKAILDVSEIEKIDMEIIKLIMQVISICGNLDIKLRVVGSDNFTQQAKGFEETKDLIVYSDKAKATDGF
jgi:two-component system cell cycle response regulator